jgi:hypothetical protein
MRYLVAGMSPHMGVRKETTAFARGAPSYKPILDRLDNLVKLIGTKDGG